VGSTAIAAIIRYELGKLVLRIVSELYYMYLLGPGLSQEPSERPWERELDR